jgi:hypothetical protein
MTVGTLPLSYSNPAGLLDLLARQRDLYTQLKALSDQQASLIADGETEQLLTLLAHRQRLVDGLTKLNRDLTAYRQAIPDLQTGLRPAERQRVRELMDEVDGLLHAIIEQDDRDRQQLHAAQQRVGQQLRQTSRSGTALNAYRSGPQRPDSRFTQHQA